MSPANQHTCECEKPPGGKVTCPASMIAICRVIDGQAIGECIDPAQFGTLGQEHEFLPILREEIAWLVKTVTQEKPQISILHNDIQMLLSGRYDHPHRNYIATFRLPDHIRRKLEAAGGRGGGILEPPPVPLESPPKIKLGSKHGQSKKLEKRKSHSKEKLEIQR